MDQSFKALRYKLEGREVDSRWCHWNIFIDIILFRAVVSGWAQPLTEMSTKNNSCGLKAAWLSQNLKASTYWKTVLACIGIALICNCNQTRRGQLKCDGTSAETRFRLSAKRTSPFKSAGSSVRLTTGSRGVRISGSSSGYRNEYQEYFLWVKGGLTFTQSESFNLLEICPGLYTDCFNL